MANRAIISTETYDEALLRSLAVARRFDAGAPVPEGDYRLNFESAAQLFAELTPKRMQTLKSLKAGGPESIYRLAKRLGRNYRNVYGDVSKLTEHGLVERDEDGRVFVPWDEVEIHLTVGSKAAA